MEHSTNLSTASTTRPIEKVLYPFRSFAHAEASGGIVLMICTVLALLWANSAWGESYVALWQTTLTIGPEPYAISKPVLLWINDGLMAVFFFVVGLEIKREVLVGELASLRGAALPIAAALGGMVVPALIYVAINIGGEGVSGWGVPMATDIAFALGVLALLGSRAPTSLKVFLTALAIVDDIGAVLVIAFFYTEKVSLAALGAAATFMLALIIINRIGVRSTIVYGLLGLGLWVAFLKSGVHATIAGILLAMTIPARTVVDTEEFLERGRALLDEFDRAGEEGESILTNSGQQSAVEELESACAAVQSPMQRLEHALHPWVAFVIVPIFALANAGVALTGNVTETVTQPVVLGVIAGLLIGKQVGVTLFAWAAVRLGITQLSEDLNWRHIYGASLLAGIGFTMSLFISGLAFGDEALLTTSKIGILAASVVAGIAGWTVLRFAPKVQGQ
ncbi:MAG: Na+/H+ antiporter NhaA [Chloroflexota bacterium]|nr:Na+/H+ antiporter NhaA [Chloroflexota bacterium]